MAREYRSIATPRYSHPLIGPDLYDVDCPFLNGRRSLKVLFEQIGLHRS